VVGRLSDIGLEKLALKSRPFYNSFADCDFGDFWPRFLALKKSRKKIGDKPQMLGVRSRKVFGCGVWEYEGNTIFLARIVLLKRPTDVAD
jgi:hypothetical protein